MAATVLIVMGLQAGLYVLESISVEFLERFMEKTMEKVNQELFYIFALLERVHPTLLEHLEKLDPFLNISFLFSNAVLSFVYIYSY